MEKLVRARRPVRLQLTELAEEVTEVLAKETLTPEEVKLLRVNGDLLESAYRSIEQLDNQVKDHFLLEPVTEEEEDAEFKEMQKYRKIYVTAKGDIDDYYKSVKSNEQVETVSVKSSSSEKKYHLPEVRIKSFNGQLKDWLGWWSQFRAIHEDEELNPVYKFQYLVQSLVPGTEAKQLVESYPMTGANYAIAVEALRERFGRPDLLLQVYIRDLLSLVISNVTGTKKLPLAQLYIQLESHLRSLTELHLNEADPATWLFPLVESSLSVETLRAWQRSSHSRMDGAEFTPKKTRLDLLMEFIKTEVRSDQQIALAQQGFQEKKATDGKKHVRFSGLKPERMEEIPTVASLWTGQSRGCTICSGEHNPERCPRLRNLTYDRQCQLLREKDLCFKCLRAGHRRNQCRRQVTCSICKNAHFEIVCGSRGKSVVAPPNANMAVKHSCLRNNEPPPKRTRFVKNQESGDLQIVAQQNTQCSANVLLNTIKVLVEVGNGEFQTVRLVGDGGSQRSFGVTDILKEARCVQTGEEWLQAVVFGAVKTIPRRYCKKRLTVIGLNGARMTIELLEKDKITGEIREIPVGPWTRECEQKGIVLNDVGDDWSDAKILVGNDYWGAMRTGRLVHLDCGLTAEETVFGWTLGGPIDRVMSCNNDIMSLTAALESVPPQPIERLWNLESLGIRDPAESLSIKEEEDAAFRHFVKTVTRDDDGRYVVALPWKAPRETLPTNWRIAEFRLRSTTHKLKISGKLDAYHAVFAGWEAEGLIAKVEDTAGHFIPHRPVFKDSATTPVRPVFDASCRQGRCPSLNDCLFKGPNLIELIPAMLLRFGENEIGVTADIRKAFQMLMVAMRDRKYQRFLWWEDTSCVKIVIYEHQRVVFGVNCSPFLLGAIIQFHLDNCGVKAALDLKKSFYVDNLVTSVKTWDAFARLKRVATAIMKTAGMELREWASTRNKCATEGSDEPGTMCILGMTWDRVEDCLSCNIKNITLDEKMTKRVMLSVVAQVFDPMGYLSPAMLIPKMIVQEMHLRKCGWDEPVPEDLRKRFEKWMSQLEILSEIKISRWNQIVNCDKREVHVFCDSSRDGIASVAFLKTSGKLGTKLQFLMSRSRLSPPKGITIPRAELVSCLIGARIARTVADALGLPGEAFKFWTDSSTALAWIRRAGDWGVFVRNRVNEILKVSKVEQWSHVPGLYNPADLPSRGCSPRFLLQSRWWEGPSWLHEDSEPHASVPEIVNEDEVKAELKKTATVIMHATLLAPRFSSYRRNVAVWGWVLRFARNCGSNLKTNESTCELFGLPRETRKYLTIEELREAEKIVVRRIQEESFPLECKDIGGIHVGKDKEGILRVQSRITRRDDKVDFVYPIVLPKTHPLVDLLVADVHRLFGHGGVQFLLSKIREKYWIIQSRRVVRRVIRKCVKCRRHATAPLEVDPAPLPKKRVNDCEVFSTTGVDLAGPLYLKNGEKVWIVVFTCAVYRTVHLDLVRSLSTEDFVLALERFVAEHGRMNTVYSDNGTNFVGAANMFSRVDWESVEAESDARQIQWIFNPPTAAWWGGWWERIVRMIKDLLKRMLGKSRLSHDELRTCLAGVAATINDRPLTMVTEDAMDLVPLTPAMFLRPRGIDHFPDLEFAEGLRGSYRTMKAVQKAIQERFRKEYLSLLVNRGGKRRTSGIAVGDVVLVGADNKKRYEWPLGVVVELCPGGDGKTRLVRVKTANGLVLRPLQRIYPLEIPDRNDESDKPVLNAPEKRIGMKTRFGREVKKPIRYGQWMHLVAEV